MEIMAVVGGLELLSGSLEYFQLSQRQRILANCSHHQRQDRLYKGLNVSKADGRALPFEAIKTQDRRNSRSLVTYTHSKQDSQKLHRVNAKGSFALIRIKLLNISSLPSSIGFHVVKFLQ
jgi:hypothetical protein